MALDGWIIGFGIEYSDGGAPAKLDALAKKVGALNPVAEKLTLNMKAAAAAVYDLGGAAKASGANIGGFGTATRAATSASSASTSASRAQAAGYYGVADAANAAAAGVARYYAAIQSAPARLVGALPAWAGGAALSRSPYSLYGARQSALPPPGASYGPIPQPSWRSGASAALSSTPMAALTGGTNPNFNARAWWANQRARGTSVGSGPAMPMGGGPGIPGGGGGWGGFPVPPVGGIPGMVGGKLLHAGMTGAKYGAEAGLGLMWDAVHEAGRFQTILTSTQNVTGANAAQMARARAAAFDVGNTAGMSPAQAAEMFREIARQSQGAMPFNDMLSMLPYASKMQVVLGSARGFSPNQTIDATMALTHLFRKYDAKDMPKMFDTVLRMGELMPDNLSKAVTQMGYFVPTIKNLHVSDEDAAVMMVALSRFGMGRGKGGTSVQNLMSNALGPLQLTAHAQKGKAKLLGPSVLDVLDAHGKSRYFTDKGGDIFGFLDKLADYEKKHGSVQSQKVFEGAFGKQGARIASILADPIMIDQLHKIHKAIVDQKSLGLESQAHSVFATAQFQEKRAWNNFQALATEVGGYALPAVTKGFKDLGDSLHWAQGWLHQNKAVGQEISKSLLDGVKGTEQYLVSHRKDWAQFGNDLAFTFREARSLAPELRHVADGFGEVYQAAKTIVGWADAVSGNGRWVGEKYVNPFLTRQQQNDPSMYGNEFGQLGPGAGTSPAGYGTRIGGTPASLLPYNAGRDLITSPLTRLLNQLPNPKPPPQDRRVQLTIDLRGGEEVSRNAVRRLVHDAIEAEVGSASDPRHHAGRHGAIFTTPRQPTRHTTTGPGG